MLTWYEINEDAKSYINSHRILVKNEAEFKFNKYLQMYPDLKKLYDERRLLVYEIAKENINNSGNKAKEKYLLLSEKLRNKLKKLKITKADILPNYACSKCQDMGFLNGEACDCLKERIYNLQLANNGFKKEDLPTFANVSFDIIKNEKEKKMQMSAYNVLKKIVDTDSKYKLISIFGGVGVGKTYMLKCVFEKALRNNLYAIYTSSFDLNQKMLEYHCAKIEDKKNIIKPYLEADVLCIDDLGTENHINNVTTEYYYLILDERTSKNKKTFITTNLNLEQIRDVYDDRIFSRLCSNINALKLNIEGSDLRLNM